MEISGLQKLTLLDFPGRTACTVFTGGCNLRCPFCHNASLVVHAPPDPIDQEQFWAFLKKRQGLLDGVCVTGGEPLLHGDLPAFLEQIRSLGYAVKLDTNGTFPDRLKQVLDAGLVDYVAMDLKNSPEKYPETCGVSDPALLEKVGESVRLLKAQTRIDVEFRTTLVAQYHTLEDIRAIGRWLAGAPHYFLQRFVDSGNLIASGLSEVPPAEATRFLQEIQSSVPAAALRGY